MKPIILGANKKSETTENLNSNLQAEQYNAEDSNFQVANPQTAVNLFQPTEKVEERSLAEKSSDKASEVVDTLFQAATLSVVQNDEAVKNKILDTAKQVVTDKTDAIGYQAEKESKASFFENNEDSASYFGYNEKTTAKSLVKIMAVWSYILNFIYIVSIGFFVVSPITFICRKIKVIVKHVWVAAILAILIYAACVFIPILINHLNG